MKNGFMELRQLIRMFIVRKMKEPETKRRIREEYRKSPPDADGVYAEDEQIGANIYLYWWRGIAQEENLGDYLSHVVVNHLVPDHGGSDQTKTLFAIGSILGFRYQKNIVVWGSGFLSSNVTYTERARLSQMDIRAVRGPKTRRLLRKMGFNCPKVYGDPGILMPMIYQPPLHEKKYKATIIPHYARPLSVDDDVQNINIISMLTTDYQSVIDAIVQSERVISGSLHGIILAEAYGIPAVLVLEKRGIGSFKYKDYYLGTGRRKFVCAHSVKEALQISPLPIPDLSAVRERLLNAFPYDIWQKKE